MYSSKQVAELLGMKPITVREMFRFKRFNGVKQGNAWFISHEQLAKDMEELGLEFRRNYG